MCIARLLHARQGSDCSILTLVPGHKSWCPFFKVGELEQEEVEGFTRGGHKAAKCHSQDLNSGRLVPAYAHDLNLRAYGQ